MSLALVAATLIAAGDTPAPPLPALPQSGSVSIVDDGEGPARDTIDAAVGAALAREGYVILPNHGRYRMQVALDEERVGVAPQPVGKGRVAFGFAAVAVPLPSHKTVLVDLVRVTLRLRIVAPGDPRPLWQATAVTVRPRPTVDAQALVDAAFATYPQTRAEPVSAP